MATFADIAINFDSVVYPLPSDSAAHSLEARKLPLLFVVGKNKNLIKPLTALTASSVVLPDELVVAEWLPFMRWAERNKRSLIEWRTLHSSAPRILDSHPAHVPHYVVNTVWPTLDWRRLSRITQLSEDDLKYSFDVFVRAIQYHNILGEGTAYFAHPLREDALSDHLALQRSQERWSWGRYLVYAMRQDAKRLDLHWYLDRVKEIRDHVQPSEDCPGARWADLDGLPLKDQHSRIEDLQRSLICQQDLRPTHDLLSPLA